MARAGSYIGTSGTQKFDVTKSDIPCASVADSGKTGLTRPKGIVHARQTTR